jgi:hypothetical protein
MLSIVVIVSVARAKLEREGPLDAGNSLGAVDIEDAKVMYRSFLCRCVHLLGDQNDFMKDTDRPI